MRFNKVETLSTMVGGLVTAKTQDRMAQYLRQAASILEGLVYDSFEYKARTDYFAIPKSGAKNRVAVPSLALSASNVDIAETVLVEYASTIKALHEGGTEFAAEYYTVDASQGVIQLFSPLVNCTARVTYTAGYETAEVDTFADFMYLNPPQWLKSAELELARHMYEQDNREADTDKKTKRDASANSAAPDSLALLLRGHIRSFAAYHKPL
jgi:hypothetical protein